MVVAGRLNDDKVEAVRLLGVTKGGNVGLAFKVIDVGKATVGELGERRETREDKEGDFGVDGGLDDGFAVGKFLMKSQRRTSLCLVTHLLLIQTFPEVGHTLYVSHASYH